MIAHDVEHPVNVGSLFRIADAFGVAKLYLTGNSPVPPNRKIRKSSRATEQAVPYEYQAQAIDVVERLRAQGHAILALEITTHSRDIRTWAGAGDRPLPLALLLGSERAGVSQAILDLADETLHVPMHGQNSSMNVTTAWAIALDELTRNA